MYQQISDNPQKSIALFLAIVIITIIGVYYPSLTVPFYLDDRQSIITNVAVHSPTLDLLIHGPNTMRLIGYATFWMNYQIGGLDPFGYHVVNIIVHILNSLLVFILALQLINHFSTGATQQSGINRKLWALAIMAIWALHPLNTQAVTYVVQRLASLVTLFYLLTIICYIRARASQSIVTRLFFSLLVGGFIVAGFLSKQNFVGVFAFLFLWELFTGSARIRQYLVWTVTFTIFAILIVSPFIAPFWQALESFTRDYNAPARTHYFYSQMGVLWDYILRFIYPSSLQMNIDVQLKRSFEPIVGLALVAHGAVMFLAYKLRKSIPLFFIGVVFMYSGHLIESFIIPIKDLAFEHRTYLSNIGMAIAFIGLLKYWLEKPDRNAKAWLMASFVVFLLVIISVATVKRNLLWQEPLTFYANEIRLAPEHARANGSYGNELLKLQRLAEAEVYIKKSVKLDLAVGKVTASGLTAFMTVLYQQEKYQQASHIVMIGLKYIHDPLDRSTLLSNLAYGYIRMGICDFAVGLLHTALKLNPNNADAKTNLSYCIQQSQQRDR